MSSAITRMVRGGGRLVLSPWISATIRRLAMLPRAISAGRARAEQRRALRELADHEDEHLLRDIAVTRREAHREGAKWFWQR